MKQYAIHRYNGNRNPAKTTGRGASTSQSSKAHKKTKFALEDRITVFDQLGEFVEKDKIKLGRTGTGLGAVKS